MEEKEITNKDWLKHYFASLLIYGVILIFLMFCPVYYETITYDKFDYTAFFTIYFLMYMLVAPIIFYTVRPKSVLNSRSLNILRYIKRQFNFRQKTEEYLLNIEPNEAEKLSLMTLFIQVFFGVYCINTLCNKYLPDLTYNFDFIKVMFQDAVRYLSMGYSIWNAIVQFLVDTGDVWLKILMMLTLCILAFSYLTESDIFKNRVKSVDTTPLGVLSCLVFYYPLIVLTDMIIGTPDAQVNNLVAQAVFILISIIANIGILIAVISLGTKSGNLTNRGIVTSFPYNIVRHPDYAMQIVYILAVSIPIFWMSQFSVMQKVLFVFSISAWIFLYYLRAITEERHLLKDDEYKAYIEKVKYRFIPKLF